MLIKIIKKTDIIVTGISYLVNNNYSVNNLFTIARKDIFVITHLSKYLYLLKHVNKDDLHIYVNKSLFS